MNVQGETTGSTVELTRTSPAFIDDRLRPARVAAWKPDRCGRETRSSSILYTVDRETPG